MYYKISYIYPHKHILDISLTFKNTSSGFVSVNLPAWRPGRYELQNYTKNIIKFSAKGDTGKSLDWHKTTKNQWIINADGADEIKVSYSFFAKQMDAGGSWLDENRIYINFINCLLWPTGHEFETCILEFPVPEDYTIACGLPYENQKLVSPNYAKLIDSPFLASKGIKSHTFKQNNTTFSLHFDGKVDPNWEKLKNDFQKFISEQIQIFGEFPEKEYLFIFIILPYPYYHGVEHNNSTIIVLGPDSVFETNDFYDKILGIGSHELFHSWNICKIRPAELMPYDLTQESYFNTGFVAEGSTTYYGDLTLVRSNVWSSDKYFIEISENLQKHMDNPARNFASLIDSSIDLWSDGYQKSHSFRKVSIYDKGALVNLILDLEIRKATNNEKSLDDVFRKLWQDHGKSGKGYTLNHFQGIAEETSDFFLAKFFKDLICGTMPIERHLAHLLDYVGCLIDVSHSIDIWESHLGIRVKKKNKESWVVTGLESGSPGDKILNIDDEIVEVDRKKISINPNIAIEDRFMVELGFKLNGEIIQKAIVKDGGFYFLNYMIRKNPEASSYQKTNYKMWLKQDFDL